jgi:hypothetical protein
LGALILKAMRGAYDHLCSPVLFDGHKEYTIFTLHRIYR